MAEGWARELKSEMVDAWSAGIEKHGMNSLAVQAMAEAGVDISGQYSKLVGDLPVQDFDYVITVCDNAHESCPLFSGRAKVIHKGFDDPPRLAADSADEEEAMTHYRRVRDEIRNYVEQLPGDLF
jgi:arsenate reductase